jgi:hypothetical protein
MVSEGLKFEIHPILAFGKGFRNIEIVFMKNYIFKSIN